MRPEVSKRIEELAIDLTNQFSVLDTPDEVKIAEKIYGIFAEMDYYKQHPEHLKFVPVKNDRLGRKSVMAIMKGQKKPSDKTVVMIGHMDTVGISDFGPLQEYANDPYVLTEKFKELSLPAEVRADLESGDYLFGRGLFDMKSGDAIIIAIMEEIARDLENFEGNLIYGAVCDEEGNSGGMINMVPELARMKREEGYDYLALLDTDYMTSEYEGDENKYVYIGTVGKLMPTFYVVGKETHVGESFKGIDPNQIASAITERINLNPEFCDVAEGEVTLPPVTLRQRDLKPEYSVQIAKTALVFFNYATHCSTPDEVLNKMMKAGQECFQSVIDTLEKRYKTFCEMAKRPYAPLPWKARTMSYDELCNQVRAEVGAEFDEKVQAFAAELMKDDDIDARDRNTKIVEYVHNMWSDKNPVIIVYFSQPYYPHIYIEGTAPKEKALLDAVADAVNTTKTDYKLTYKKFFPYISDLSYGAAPKEESIVATFKQNMPGFGTVYDLPLEDMQELNLPVLDIGSFGKDAHKFTERIEKKYTFEVAPELVYKTIMNLLK